MSETPMTIERFNIDTQTALIAEVERLRLVNKRLNRRAQSAEAAADANAGDWNKRAAGAQLRNHYYVRAEAAEAENARLALRLAESHEVIVTLKECADAANRRAEAAEARVTLLEDAIREWQKAGDDNPSAASYDRYHAACDTLRALVVDSPSPLQEDGKGENKA